MAVVPDTRDSIVIKKMGPYRGTTREWSNRYHFEGGVPASDADWATFADNITDAEQLVLDSATTIVEAVGYDSSSATATNPHGLAVYTKTYSKVGTGGPWASSTPSPGDAAALVRYDTGARSSRNHPVYLFNYYHSCWQKDSDSDQLSAALRAALETYADDWVTGFSDGSVTHDRCGPHGAAATGRRVDPFVRHRDFPN